MDGREHESVGGQPGMTIDLSPKIFAPSLSEINGVEPRIITHSSEDSIIAI